MPNWCSVVRRRHSMMPFPKTEPSHQKKSRESATGTFNDRPVAVVLKNMSVPKRQNYWNKFPIISKLATMNVSDAPSSQFLCERTDCHGQFQKLATSLPLWQRPGFSDFAGFWSALRPTKPIRPCWEPSFQYPFNRQETWT